MRSRNEQPPRTILLRALERGEDLDHHKAARLTGLSVRNAREYLKMMHTAGDCHIDRWASNRQGPKFPVYVEGRGEDAAKPDVKVEKALRRRGRRIVATRSIVELVGLKMSKLTKKRKGVEL